MREGRAPPYAALTMTLLEAYLVRLKDLLRPAAEEQFVRKDPQAVIENWLASDEAFVNGDSFRGSGAGCRARRVRCPRGERAGRGREAFLGGAAENQAGADMEPRNSVFVLFFVSRLSRSSMASTVERGLRTLRRTQTRLSSSGGRSNSSLRVPER